MQPVAVGKSPAAVAVDADINTVYVANAGDNTVVGHRLAHPVGDADAAGGQEPLVRGR